MTELNSDEGRPLTEEEIAEFRKLLEKERRVTWIWTTFRVWATWITAITAAYIAGKQIIVDLISKLTAPN